ncbi:MAG: hypothetical protein JNJ78_14645, partial [Anaerolineae bacterium]|nr:hypothetical protein [Anaerolineae bacterium]
MADEIIKSTYQIDIDQARLRNVLTGVRSFRQTINETVQSVKTSDVTLRQAGQSIDAYSQRVRDVQDRLDRAGRTVDVYKNELKELRAELESQATAEEKVARARQRSASIPGGSASGGSANDRFDAVS